MRPTKAMKARPRPEERRRRAEEWDELGGEEADDAAFCPKDIYDGYAAAECGRCGREHDVEAEIFFEIFGYEDLASRSWIALNAAGATRSQPNITRNTQVPRRKRGARRRNRPAAPEAAPMGAFFPSKASKANS